VKEITLDDIKHNHEVDVYLRRSFEYLLSLGFNEHGLRHASLIADLSASVLRELRYADREQQLAAIAGYMHDIGNMVNRFNHGHAGAMLAYGILGKMGMPPEELALVLSAIGNHEEDYGHAVNPIAAALILADKSDVHRSRVCNTKDVATFDIHDRVNYAAEKSHLHINFADKLIILSIKIDQDICPIIEYFEIFLHRMLMCRRAAGFLGCQFELFINEANLM
jgi:metal-dependent HD superfamily phosphatase/phosphodiesterase